MMSTETARRSVDCPSCGETHEEPAIHGGSECRSCTETALYPLSPLYMTLYNSLIQE